MRGPLGAHSEDDVVPSISWFKAMLWAFIPSLVLTACDGPSTASGNGELDIVIATEGSPLDPDGYTLVVRRAEGALPVTEQAVGVEATVVLSDVEPGIVIIELRGLAAGCVVQGEHPRALEVRGQVGNHIDLTVVCGSGA
jgi:hypothetical protein